MKKILLFMTAAICLMACNSNSYSNQLKAEKKLIQSFMDVQGYTITDELPEENTIWPEKLFYRIPITSTDFCFIHISEVGDTTISAIRNQTVVLRYRQYTLTQPSDTINNWSTLDTPGAVEFNYMTDNTGYSCSGWQYALQYMRHPGAVATIIVPSKLGFSADQNSVTPYGYDLMIKRLK